MSNAFMSGLQAATNFKLTENGGVAHRSTGTDLYDMFALGGAYRTRTNEDCILLFKNAYEEIEDEDLAEDMLQSWLAYGVPDGNELVDNITDFGGKKEFDELIETYFDICEEYRLRKVFLEEVEEIKKNIVEMLDNPYYNMV